MCMSFQAYITNIEAKTGKTPENFKALAIQKGFIKDNDIVVKVGDILTWLKTDFELSRGYSMAIVATFKGKTD
jgi:hypothetical protein